MPDQPSLFASNVEPDELLKLDAFHEYHRANPHVWRAFERLAFEAIRAGRSYYSARDILAVLRWDTGVRGVDPTGFKLINNWSPWYARLFEEQHPEHAGFFRKRRAAADEAA